MNNTNTQITSPRKNRGLSLFANFSNALILISLGVVLLLNNFGYLPWEIWQSLVKFWPILIIFWGLQVLAGGSILLNMLFSLLAIVLVFVILTLTLIISNTPFKSWLNNKYPNLWNLYSDKIASINQRGVNQKTYLINDYEYESVNSIKTNLNLDFGRFSITDTYSNYFFKASSSYTGKDPDISKKKLGDTLTIDVETGKKGFPGLGDDLTSNIEFGKPDIATAIDIELGAGTLDLNLTNTNVTNFNLNVGAGNATLGFTTTSLPLRKSKIEIGAGKVDLAIPEIVGLKVKYNVGFGKLNVGGKSLQRDGTFVSDNYDNADKTLELDINVGAGSFNITSEKFFSI